MGDERFMKNFDQKSVRGREHVQDLGIHGRVILKCILKIGLEIVDLFCIVEDKD
jgi:hypothetical protein